MKKGFQFVLTKNNHYEFGGKNNGNYNLTLSRVKFFFVV